MKPGRRSFLNTYPYLPAAAILAATGLVIAACSDLGDRMDRARDLAETAGDQVSGDATIEAGDESALQAASVEDRALGGGMILNAVNYNPDDRMAAPLFAVGSIIVKPIDIPEAPAAAVIEEDVYFVEDPAVLEDLSDDQVAGPAEDLPEPVAGSAPAPPSREVIVESLPEIDLDPAARDKTMREMRRAEVDLKDRVAKEPMAIKRTRSLKPREFKPINEDNAQDVKRLARRSVLTQEAVTAQLDANQLMLNVLDKYDMAGSVQPSRNGQMVISLGIEGAAPTQFTPEQVANAPAAFLAVEKAGGCANPDNIEKVKQDAALATECVIAELKETNQFEYVEKDYIFANQFFKRPPEPQPKPPTPSSTGSTSGKTGNTGSTGTKPPTPTGPVTVTPNDPLWTLQWHFRNNGAGAGQSQGGAGFQDFWSRQAIKGSSEVVVAVVDTGLQMQHPDIKNSPNLAPGWDMVTPLTMSNDGDGRDANPDDPGDLCTEVYGPSAEDSFHGTHVAGTIGAAATDNGSGVAGGAWQVKIVPVRALGKCGGRLSDINDAIRWSAGEIAAIDPVTGAEVWNPNVADIINLSIGLFGACPQSMQDAINQVTAKGVIVVSAAGNARMATSLYAPGGCQNVISVAAGDALGQIAPYSNFGPEVDLLAPGGDLTKDLNGDTRPDGVLSTKAAKNCIDPVTGESVGACFYAYEQGTSMAAPHVSAALALIKAKSPTATPEELIATLLAASDERSVAQCSGLCSQFPGATPAPGSADMCLRPCGRMLNLARIPAAASGGGGRTK